MLYFGADQEWRIPWNQVGLVSSRAGQASACLLVHYRYRFTLDSAGIGGLWPPGTWGHEPYLVFSADGHTSVFCRLDGVLSGFFKFFQIKTAMVLLRSNPGLGLGESGEFRLRRAVVNQFPGKVPALGQGRTLLRDEQGGGGVEQHRVPLGSLVVSAEDRSD